MDVKAAFRFNYGHQIHFGVIDGEGRMTDRPAVNYDSSSLCQNNEAEHNQSNVDCGATSHEKMR